MIDVSAIVAEEPEVDLAMPTLESLRAEAAALGDGFAEVSAHPADVIADAEEMLGAKQDLADLSRRGYAVSEGLLTRIRLLVGEIAPALAEQDRVQALTKAQTEAAEGARKELLSVRRELASIGKAARLPASLFSLETRRTTRLNVVMMKMEEVLANVRALRPRLPDKARVDQLVTRASQLIDEQKQTRQEARLMRTFSKAQTAERQRLVRLLYDAMLHLSAQGLAAYPNDAVRAPRYRLDHVYGRKASVVGDPGAGGSSGVSDAAGPLGDDDAP